jgi:DNA polymerase V
MGDVARCSIGKPTDYKNEDLLYRLFGINAELIIDHAWGWEPTEIGDCKDYTPEAKSLSQGQVLSRPYTAAEARVVVQEMADQLSMDLVRKGLYTDLVVLDIAYDVENLIDPKRAEAYKGEIITDYYGRRSPKPAHGSQGLGRHVASTERIVEAVRTIFDRIADETLLMRRFNVAVVNLLTADEVKEAESKPGQLDLFTDYEAEDRKRKAEDAALEKETRRQKALLNIRDKYGKNAVVRGLNLQDGATAIERNAQIGGHKA